INTRNILFICGGAFDGLERIVRSRTGRRAMGFGSGGASPEDSDVGYLLSRVEPEDLIQYGLIPELIGRLPVVSSLHPLSDKALLDILVKPKNALTRQYQKLFEMDGLSLRFEPDALEKVVALTQEKAMGARGLRAVLETAMYEIMFELPSKSDVKECIITADFIEAKGPPTFVPKRKRAYPGGRRSLDPTGSRERSGSPRALSHLSPRPRPAGAPLSSAWVTVEHGKDLPGERYRYPTRVPVPETGRVWRYGRVTHLSAGGGTLRHADREVPFTVPGLQARRLRVGDTVALGGLESEGVLTAEAVEVLAPSLRPPESGSWDRAGREAATRHRHLAGRRLVVQAVRGYFEDAGFTEVETPSLVAAPGQEPHLDPLSLVLPRPSGRLDRRFLITSPEHHMKRLLGEGYDRVYQIGRCYRGGEESIFHRPEFTMVEWYRAYASYQEVAVDTEELVAQTAVRLHGTTDLRFQGARASLKTPWRRLSVAEAVEQFAGIDLDRAADAASLRAEARAAGAQSVGEGDSWEEAYFKVMLELVEPGLASLGAVLLVDYPVSQAALAKLRYPDRAVAERVEAYVCGVELANGFTELNDPREQRRRFMAGRRRRRERGGPVLPMDEPFLAMMERGMPPAGGVALGLDRLAMLLGNAETIDQVVAFKD
ncbi:MAG: EF-P lysine aminoacylase EpmA, partial [Gemmatimonadota bacterium]